MKKIVSLSWLLAAMLIAGSAFAQASFGVKGSFNMFNLAQKDADGDKIENKMIPAFDAGVFAEIPLADEFALRPELLFATKGAKTKSTDVKIPLSYVELPILFLYKGGLSNGKVLLGFGPYVGFGVAGDKFKDDIFKPFDFGGKIMAGYEFGSGISMAINASNGLVDIEKADLDSSTKNVGFGLTLGYRF